MLELSQTVVRNYFTMIIIAALPPDTDTKALSVQLLRIIGTGAAVNLLPYQSSHPPLPDSDRYILTALGDDSPGIVHDISSLIAERMCALRGISLHRCRVCAINTTHTQQTFIF
jgi:glycine cleavage system transcriptional repressor